jgi:hypothetical protein
MLAAANGFSVLGVLAPDRPMGAGDYAWEDAGVPQGELTIVVDLAWQRLYAYRGGVEIGRAAILYGADEKPTPTGTFKILQKKKDHISNLYGAPMPFMLRLTNDGIAITAARSRTVMRPTAASACRTNSRPCCSSRPRSGRGCW